MKVVLGGAFGNLGRQILKELVDKNYDVLALDLKEYDIEGLDKTKFIFRSIDVCNKNSLVGCCSGADIVISTIGLTSSSNKVTNYDIDLDGNLNLLNEAVDSKVKKFIYVSVIKANEGADIPMLDAKFKFENELKKSGIEYIIYRPIGYFYDIAKVFMPMIDKGKVTLLGKKDVYANVISTEDFAKFITLHIDDINKTFSIGGRETYSYKEIATMFFDAAGKKVCIKYAPKFLFSILAKIAKRKRNGKEAIIKFSKWTLTNDMVGEVKYGDMSFKEYIYSRYNKEKK